MLPITYVEARDVPDAWFQCISKLQEVGFKYINERGSFEGESRLEFDWITIQISHPYSEPYDTMLPQIPHHLGFPNPVKDGYIEEYLPYLMTGEKKEGEDYSYGQRLWAYVVKTCITVGYIWHGEYVKSSLWREEDAKPVYNIEIEKRDQVSYWIEVLKKTPNTNQAILQVAQPSDRDLKDSPCLRHIDMRVKDNKLIFYPYFRSWDLWGGFPANLAAIAVLQKYMADEIGINTGPIIASSKGLHIYGYVEELAKLRVGR